jgi:hypothetical protein
VPLQHDRPNRTRAVVASAFLVAAAIATNIGSASAAPPPPFTLTPSSISFSTTLNGFDYEFVTLTTGNKKIPMSSPQSTTLPFFDTQGGTCWQSYGALGQLIPARTSCTIQVGFHPTGAGPFSDSLTATACKKWHLDPTYGFILCDTLDGSQSISLTGTVQVPDLIVTGIILGDGGASPYGWILTVKNQGTVAVNVSGVSVQGYWSPDGSTYDPDTQNPACGTAFGSGTIIGVGGSIPLTVACSLGNVSGESYVGAEVDSADTIVESDETNNVGFGGMPDLIVDDITIDGPSDDQPFNSTVTVKNVGVGPAVLHNSVLTVQAWYSADATLDAGDTPACGDLLFTSPGSIPVNGTVDAHIGCPATPGAGDAYLIVQADAPNPTTVIPEIDETNNFGNVALPT